MRRLNARDSRALTTLPPAMSRIHRTWGGPDARRQYLALAWTAGFRPEREYADSGVGAAPVSGRAATG